MKKTRLKRKSKSPLKKLEDKIWALCRLITFKKHGNTCYTCGAKNLVGHNLQCGHLWAKASLGAYLKYDLRVLRPQCMRCNLHLGGMGAVYYVNMVEEIGEEKMKELVKDRQITVKAMEYYPTLLEKYENIIETL